MSLLAVGSARELGGRSERPDEQGAVGSSVRDGGVSLSSLLWGVLCAAAPTLGSPACGSESGGSDAVQVVCAGATGGPSERLPRVAAGARARHVGLPPGSAGPAVDSESALRDFPGLGSGREVARPSGASSRCLSERAVTAPPSFEQLPRLSSRMFSGESSLRCPLSSFSGRGVQWGFLGAAVRLGLVHRLSRPVRLVWEQRPRRRGEPRGPRVPRIPICP